MKKKVTTAIILEKKRPLKNGTHAVKLRVTWNRISKYYGTGHHFNKADFEKVRGAKPRNGFKTAKLELNAIEEKAIRIIDSIVKSGPFTFEIFERKFLGVKGNEDCVFSSFESYIEELKKEGQAGTKSTYVSSLQSFKAFTNNKKTLKFTDVSPNFLIRYEKKMDSAGKSLTTVSIYTRALRKIFNRAIKCDIVDAKLYPFGKESDGKYQIPAVLNIKKALKMEEISKILDYEPQSTEEAKAKDFWVFTYLCQGVNMKDIARLRYRNKDGDKLTFIRAKTARTGKKKTKKIEIILLPEAQAIIDRWGQAATSPDSYIFPILTKNSSILAKKTPEERERTLVKQFTRTTNNYMKRIADAVGITKPVTTYTARHSYATILKRSGAPIAFISDSLGHGSLETTQNYLGSFEDESKRQYAKALLPT